MKFHFLTIALIVTACKTAPSTKPYYDSLERNKDLDAQDPCPEENKECHPKRFLVADDGKQQISLVNLDDPSKDWDLKVEATIWDMNLAGDGILLVPTTEGIGGFHEIDIQSGKIIRSHTELGFVRTVQRLSNGNTLVVGENLKGNEGTVALEITKDGEILESKTKRFPKIKNSRVIRRTEDNTYLMGSTIDNENDHYLIEMDQHGYELMRFRVGSGPAHMGLRLGNGDTLVTSGRDLKLIFFSKDGKVKREIKMQNQDGKIPIDPFQAGYFQILENGHFVMNNWQGKNPNLGRKGRQLVEYNAEGKQVWAWKQDPQRFSSISAFIILDGLNLQKAYDDSRGSLQAIK